MDDNYCYLFVIDNNKLGIKKITKKFLLINENKQYVQFYKEIYIDLNDYLRNIKINNFMINDIDSIIQICEKSFEKNEEKDKICDKNEYDDEELFIIKELNKLLSCVYNFVGQY